MILFLPTLGFGEMFILLVLAVWLFGQDMCYEAGHMAASLSRFLQG